MPPLLQGLQDISDRVLGIFRPGQRPDQAEQSNAASHKDDDDDDEVEEVDAAVVTGGKRGRGGGDVGRAAKKRRPSAHEQRLLPPDTATAPKDATSISFPTSGKGHYDAEEDWNPSNRPRNNMARHGGGFKPVNTLGNSTRQGAKSNGSSGGSGFFKSYTGNGRSPKLQTHSSRGGNVTRKLDFPENEVQLSDHPRKRQKTHNNLASDPVDLTEDDDAPFGQAIAIAKTGPARSQKSGSESSSKPKPQDEISTSYEQNLVDNMMDYGEASQSRHATVNGHAYSSHASAKNSDRARPMNRDAQHHAATQPPVFTIEDDEPQANGRKAQSPPQQAGRSRKELPTIDLGKNENEYVELNRQRIEKARGGTVQGSREVSHPTDDLFEQTLARRKQMQSMTERATPGNRSRRHQQDGMDVSARLEHTFRRDDGLQQKTKQTKLADRMQTISAPGRTSLSEDELLGEKTVGSPRSRNASPSKQELRPGAMRSNGTLSGNQSDVSQVGKRTALKGSRPSLGAAHSKQQPEKNRDVRVPIRAIYCKGCLLREEDLVLKWDETAGGFLVVCGKQVKRVFDKGPQIIIGPNQVSHWLGCERALEVVLKGPLSEISHGHIMVAFKDEGGLEVCLDTLMSADPTLEDKQRNLEVDMMQRIFSNQVKEAVTAYKQLEAKYATPRQPRRQAQRPVEEEQIMYENDDPPPPVRRSRARDRMQGDTMADALNAANYQSPRGMYDEDGTTSRHFNQQQPRRSGRQPKPVEVKERTPSPPRWTRENNPPRWSHSVTYPDQGKSRVTVDFQDLERLDEGEFLNDNVVNFELRWIEENMAPEHRAKVHFFNTYFFSSMCHKNGKKEFNYDAVSRWTKKIDLFTIPYVVVPINVELHWFVAIICNLPAIERKFKGFDDSEDGIEEKPSAANSVDGQDVQLEAQEDDVEESANAGNSPTLNKFTFNDDGTVEHTQAIDEEQAPPSSRPGTATSKKGKKKKGGASMRKYDPKEPIIMSLDSFNLGRSAEIKYLKLYVESEARSKRSMEIDHRSLPGMSAKGIPEQPNFCDCGVYLLGYVEEFAKDPDAFVRKVLTKQMDRENDFAGFDASAKRDEIRQKLLVLQEQQEAARTAQKKAKQAAKAARNPKAQQEAPAESTQKENVPASSSQKPSTPAPAQPQAHTAGPTSSAPRTSPSAKDKHSTQPLSNEEDNSLEVEPPSYMGQSNHEDSPRAASSQLMNAVGDGEEDSMLDDVDRGDCPPSDRAEVSAEQQPPSNIYKGGLPVAPSSGDLLGGLEEYANDREKSDGPSTNGLEVIEVESGDETKPAEIPDSQEQAQTSRKKKRTPRRIS